jgi:MSHA biogenesis protein MshP
MCLRSLNSTSRLAQNTVANMRGAGRDTQAGFAIVSAIFLVIVLAVLGATMLTFSSAQHAGSAMDVQGARAYQAARAGIEWGAYQVLRNSSCAGNTTLTLAGDLSGYVVAVACAAFPTGGTLNVYQITSTASVGTVGQLGRVERQLRARIAK